MYRFFSYKYIMYKKKYLKYKLKYLNLKKKLEGGSNTYNVFNTLEESNLDFEKLEKELNKKSNKILIVLYAPWCGFCHEFIETENSVYSQLIKDKNINIYKVDCTKEGEDLNNIKNKLIDLDKVSGQIVGYPTIIKVNTETNIVKQYQGDRSKNSILDYFKE